MIRGATQTKGWLARVMVIAFIALAATAAQADTWRGTAPFCEGQCRAGERQVRTSDCGNGACCVTGHKVLCTTDAPLCTPRQTRTSCSWFLLMCDDGLFDSANRWVSCSKYVCGACVGI